MNHNNPNSTCAADDNLLSEFADMTLDSDDFAVEKKHNNQTIAQSLEDLFVITPGSHANVDPYEATAHWRETDPKGRKKEMQTLLNDQATYFYFNKDYKKVISLLFPLWEEFTNDPKAASNCSESTYQSFDLIIRSYIRLEDYNSALPLLIRCIQLKDGPDFQSLAAQCYVNLIQSSVNSNHGNKEEKVDEGSSALNETLREYHLNVILAYCRAIQFVPVAADFWSKLADSLLDFYNYLTLPNPTAINTGGSVDSLRFASYLCYQRVESLLCSDELGYQPSLHTLSTKAYNNTHKYTQQRLNLQCFNDCKGCYEQSDGDYSVKPAWLIDLPHQKLIDFVCRYVLTPAYQLLHLDKRAGSGQLDGETNVIIHTNSDSRKARPPDIEEQFDAREL
jgi:hypothetical protein